MLLNIVILLTISTLQVQYIVLPWTLTDSRALKLNHVTDFCDVGVYPVAHFYHSIGFYSNSDSLPNISKPTSSIGECYS